ncbi:hypothetical protein AQPE_4882 [Aquipluma nitroreducens]|uniref:Uncharacterized protein n=1 Tax=Aquipluma nitroreducens TaxID=2010828 RepID=A0A5K7SGJ5_9BACT|nr:hypothetical protein AQPE_4882 [Aquipluma nitroreducens]
MLMSVKVKDILPLLDYHDGLEQLLREQFDEARQMELR